MAVHNVFCNDQFECVYGAEWLWCFLQDNLLLDMYLAPHVKTLYSQIRNRALIQVRHAVNFHAFSNGAQNPEGKSRGKKVDSKNETWRCSVETDLINKSWIDDHILFYVRFRQHPNLFGISVVHETCWLKYPFKLWRYRKFWYTCWLFSEQTEMSYFHFHCVFHMVFLMLGLNFLFTSSCCVLLFCRWFNGTDWGVSATCFTAPWTSSYLEHSSSWKHVNLYFLCPIFWKFCSNER